MKKPSMRIIINGHAVPVKYIWAGIFCAPVVYFLIYLGMDLIEPINQFIIGLKNG